MLRLVWCLAFAVLTCSALQAQLPPRPDPICFMAVDLPPPTTNGPPDYVVQPSGTLDFKGVKVGMSAWQKLCVTAASSYEFQVVSTADPPFSVVPNTFSTGVYQLVTAQFTPASPLAYAGNVIFSANGGPPFSVAVKGTGTTDDYAISGQVKLAGNALSGVMMSLSGSQNESTTTNESGNYSFTVPGGSTYTVRPSLAGYSFAPMSMSFQNLSDNQTADFNAAPVLSFAGAIPEVASGGFETTFTLLNTGAAAAQFALNFYAEDGSQLQLPLIFPNNHSLTPVTTASYSATLGAGAGLVIQTNVCPVQCLGSAQLLTNGRIGGFAVLTDTLIPSQVMCVGNPVCNTQAAEYFETPVADLLLWFDNTNGFSTAIAVANVFAQPANVTVMIRDDSGKELTTQTFTLPGLGHTQFNLTMPSTYPANTDFRATQNIRGTLELSTTNAQISVLGLSFSPNFDFTSTPLLVK